MTPERAEQYAAEIIARKRAKWEVRRARIVRIAVVAILAFLAAVIFIPPPH